MKLSSQAIQVLEELKNEPEKTISQFESEGYDQSMVNRAALELEEKGLIDFEEESEFEQVLTDKGKEVIENASPEYQLVERLEDGPKEMSDIQDIDLDVAIGKARKKQWINIRDGEVSLTEEGRNQLGSDEVKRRLEKGSFEEEDEERGLVASKESTVRILKLNEKGKSIDIEEVVEEFNVEASTKTPRTGKRHFYKNILDFAREKWVEMGFEEMSGDFVVPSLLNFDALYTPQDHPARELHDTFFVKNPEKTDLSVYDETQAIKETHEDGWTTGSKGWGYDWSEEDAEKNVLRTHTTAVSAKKLSELEEEDLPKKFFIIGKNFRNETVDRHHLAEFYQTDGIVVGRDLNFKNLKGYISEFFEKMGYSQFRLVPAYYPYTEMSVEVHVRDPESGEWISLGGAGMFRPEVVKPLLGFEATVLAWGLGIPRIAAGAADLTDIRDLYRNDIEILEQTPVWRPE